MSELIGQNLGRYKILDLLGEGGMATVFKAYDTRLEREVAIKIIRHEAFPPNQLTMILKRFEREAKALAGLSHPNIVGVIDYGEYEGLPYLVMVYLSGGTFRDRIARPMPWRNAIRLLIPVAHALEYTHEHNIIHRDIKPSNILMTEKGQPMLTDFGLVKLFEEKGTTNLTASGTGLGTPDYMAPEQWTGEATALSDLYSLGVVLYEMITARRPYISDTPAGILLKQVNEPLPRPTQYVPDLPQDVESVLLKALAANPGDRYADMHSFTDALQELLDGREVGTAATKTKVLQEQMGEGVEGQLQPGQIEGGQTRNVSYPSIPGKAIRGNRFGIAAGGIGAGLCACLALVTVGFLAMNGFNNIPGSLPTASVTPPQNTPIPTSAVSNLTSFTISGCTYSEECPDAVGIVDLFGENQTLEYNTEYKVSIAQDKKILFFSGWCAINRITLEKNLDNMEFVFTIDGQSYLENTKQEYYYQQNEDDSTKQNACYAVGGVISGWQQANTYRVIVGPRFEKLVFDGWDNYPQGEQFNIYLITVE